MEKLFQTSKFVVEAKNAQKGYHIVVEVLFFLLTYLIASFAQSAVIAPVTFIVMLTDKEYIKAAASLDQEKLVEITSKIVQSDSIMLASLFSTIGIIIICLLFGKLIQKRKISTLGFQNKKIVSEYGVGIIIGFVMFSIAILICFVTGSIQLESDFKNISIGLFLFTFVGFLIQGMAEEVLMRGFFMVSIARRYPMFVAVFVNSVAFSMLHLLNPGITGLALVNLTLFGIFASVYFVKRGSIWGVAAIHSVWNFTQGNIYGIQVSGLNFRGSIFRVTSDSTRGIINGGSFGLEGGLAVTIVLVVGIVLVMLKMKQREVWTEEGMPIDVVQKELNF